MCTSYSRSNSQSSSITRISSSLGSPILMASSPGIKVSVSVLSSSRMSSPSIFTYTQAYSSPARRVTVQVSDPPHTWASPCERHEHVGSPVLSVEVMICRTLVVAGYLGYMFRVQQRQTCCKLSSKVHRQFKVPVQVPRCLDG